MQTPQSETSSIKLFSLTEPSTGPFFGKSFLLTVAIVLSALSGFFYKAVFLGKPITKLGLLRNIDAVLNPTLKDAVIPIGRDPSGYLIFFPNGHFCEQVWSRFVIPLWNPLVACGFPLLGDPQSFIHSPAHILGLFSSPAAYNFGLLLEIALGGIGMVVAARLLSLSMVASILAALAYSLSPRVLVQIDIGGNEEFFPWIVACFIWAAKKPSYLRSAIAGAASAILVFAAHPETSFFAVLTAGALGFCMIALGCKDSIVKDDTSPDADEALAFQPANLWLATKLMSVAALASMCVVAPLLVPFLQFMRQASVYKDALSVAELPFVTWKSFWDGVLVNQGYEPYFIGSIAVLLLPFAFSLRNRYLAPLMLCSFFIFAVSVPQGPLLDLLSKKPFNYVSTLYGVPDLLLLMSLLAGFGLDALFKSSGKKLLIPLFCGTILAAFFPLLFCLEGSNYVLSDAWKANQSLLTYTSIFAIAAAILISVWIIRPVAASKVLAVVALLSLNFASLAVSGRTILQNCPPYDMTTPAPLKFLADSNERTVSTGNNFVLPNASMNYGVRELRAFCPVLPRRYMTFLHACGANVYNNYFYRMPDACSDLLDAASIKYVLTRSAVFDANDGHENMIAMGKSLVGGVMPGMRITKSELFYDPANRQVNFDFSLRIMKPCNHRYAIQFCVADRSGKLVFSGNETRLSIVDSARDNSYQEGIPIPDAAQFPVRVGFRIRDTWTSQWIHPKDTLRAELKEKSALPNEGREIASTGIKGEQDDLFVVALPKLEPSRAPSAAAHYKLVREFKDEACRIYENTRALPQAYFVESVLHIRPCAVDTYDGVLDRLREPSFDMHQRAIVEDFPPEEFKDTKDNVEYKRCVLENAERSNAQIVPAKVERPDSNTVICTFETTGGGYLVLTDSNYDGWHCTVDGKDARIYDCNLLFKSVRIRKFGKHIVKFTFAPTSYYVSLAVSLLTLLGIGACSFLKRKSL